MWRDWSNCHLAAYRKEREQHGYLIIRASNYYPRAHWHKPPWYWVPVYWIFHNLMMVFVWLAVGCGFIAMRGNEHVLRAKSLRGPFSEFVPDAGKDNRAPWYKRVLYRGHWETVDIDAEDEILRRLNEARA